MMKRFQTLLSISTCAAKVRREVLRRRTVVRQGLTLVHLSAQLEPCLTADTQKHPAHQKHPLTPLNTGYTIPTCTPYEYRTEPVYRK